MKQLLIGTFLFFGLIFGVEAQDFQMPQASPGVTLQQGFSTSFIKIEYSRPSMNGRKIFGDLVPFDAVWRTGANASTKITFGEEVFIGDGQLKPGTYALFTIPGEREWKVIFNSDTQGWGAGSFDEKKNDLSISIPAEYVKENKESFSITLENLTKNTADIVLGWADVRISIPVKADNHERIMEYLKKELSGEKPPYFRAASYMLETGEDLKSALRYVDAAIKEVPEAYYMYWTKAQIQDQLGLQKEAIESAKFAAELARKTSPAYAHEYERNYKNLMEKTRGGKSESKIKSIKK